MDPKYSVYITRWDVYRIRRIEARSEEEAEEHGRERFEETTGHEHTEGGYDSIQAELEED